LAAGAVRTVDQHVNVAVGLARAASNAALCLMAKIDKRIGHIPERD